ncbi:MAG: M15 family metallopeptidase [Ruminococcus sp.]|nr:M15 family metallopeptidase [Ruminococcus sp.]
MTKEEKKLYRSSKKRRKQAVIAAETGRIVPIKSGRKRLILILFVAFPLIIAAAIAAACFLLKPGDDRFEAAKKAPEQNQMLLRVVNRSNPLDSHFVPELTEASGVKISPDMADSLEKMLEAAKQSGIELKLVSGYISYDEQDVLYKDKLKELRQNSDFSEVRAQAQTAKLVPRAGESEAQTGLLVGFDVSDERAETFLERDCVKYGFVRRYTEEKEDITRMTANRSLYRFVSEEHAVKLRAFGMCLEEYENYLAVQGAP